MVEEGPGVRRVGGKGGGTIGLLALGLYEKLVARGVEFDAPPHDEPWERLAWARDPDGYTLEFAQGERTASPRARKRRRG